MQVLAQMEVGAVLVQAGLSEFGGYAYQALRKVKHSEAHSVVIKPAEKVPLKAAWCGTGMVRGIKGSGRADLLSACEVIAKSECEYGEGNIGCYNLPTGVKRPICAPCRARHALVQIGA